MISKINIKILLAIIIVATGGYILISSLIGDDKIGENKFSYLKSFLNNEQKEQIKKFIFPYKVISKQEQRISQLTKIAMQQKQNRKILQPILLNLELNKKKLASDIETEERVISLSNNLTLKKFHLLSGFYYGINIEFPGSGYIDFYDDNIFVLSSRGVLAFRKDHSTDKESFKQIKNNINEFIGEKQLGKGNWFSIKDLYILNNKVFISYTEEIEEDCWNTSIIFGNINFEKIEFKKLFSPIECVHSINNIDKEFNAHQSGGKIISIDNDHILLTIGDYRSRHLAQNKKSLNGKIIKINIKNNQYQMISMGHRNPQGLYFDEENKFVLETEHGPLGGDEINLIEISKIGDNKIQNYGWPISSVGKHYVGTKKKYEKYPLHDSHSEYGYIEPLKSFYPSIGISEIVKIGQNKYVVGSMKRKSLYFFELNDQREIIGMEKVEVHERIRDLRFHNNRLYLFMENTASVGIINLS